MAENTSTFTGAAADGTAAVGTPFQIFSSGVAGLLEMFGLPILSLIHI